MVVVHLVFIYFFSLVNLVGCSLSVNEIRS